MSSFSRHAVLWFGLLAVGASIVLGARPVRDRMVLFHMEGKHEPSLFGMMRTDLMKLEGNGAGRIKRALERGPLKVWQYALYHDGGGKHRLVPERQIELTSADAAHIRFGARIVLPPD
jgi:hypothetical protein